MKAINDGDAVIEMKQPGVWILGETDPYIRRSGMGIVVECEPE
jgi:hypothetical protein